MKIATQSTALGCHRQRSSELAAELFYRKVPCAIICLKRLPNSTPPTVSTPRASPAIKAGCSMLNDTIGTALWNELLLVKNSNQIQAGNAVCRVFCVYSKI